MIYVHYESKCAPHTSHTICYSQPCCFFFSHSSYVLLFALFQANHEYILCLFWPVRIILFALYRISVMIILFLFILQARSCQLMRSPDSISLVFSSMPLNFYTQYIINMFGVVFFFHRWSRLSTFFVFRSIVSSHWTRYEHIWKVFNFFTISEKLNFYFGQNSSRWYLNYFIFAIFGNICFKSHHRFWFDPLFAFFTFQAKLVEHFPLKPHEIQ